MTHDREVMGSNPGAVEWLNMKFFTLICCKNCIVCLKRLNINEKRPVLAHLQKVILACSPYICVIKMYEINASHGAIPSTMENATTYLMQCKMGNSLNLFTHARRLQWYVVKEFV